MNPRVPQFAAIILTALDLVPGGAHALELAGKIGLDQAAYFTVQAIYRGWSMLGAILFAALLANVILAVVSRHQRPPMLLAAGAACLIAATLVIFFGWTYPANQATENWTVTPDTWRASRVQWEYSHAVNAGLTFLALCATTLSALLWRR